MEKPLVIFLKYLPQKGRLKSTSHLKDDYTETKITEVYLFAYIAHIQMTYNTFKVYNYA